jgi:hypothetical protein
MILEISRHDPDFDRTLAVTVIAWIKIKRWQYRFHDFVD